MPSPGTTNRNRTHLSVPTSEADDDRARTEALYQDIFEQSPVGMLHVDSTGMVTAENQRLRAITSRSWDASWIGQKVDAIQEVDDGLGELIRRMFHSGHPFTEDRVTYSGQKGTSGVFRIHGAPIRRADGSIVGGALAFFETTVDDTVEEELRVRRIFDSVEPLLRNAALSLPSEHSFLDEVARLLGTTAQADQVYVLLSAEDADAYEEEVRWAREPERSLVPLRMDVVGTRLEQALAEGVVHLSIRQGATDSEWADASEGELLHAIGAAEALAVRFVTAGEQPGVLLLTRAAASEHWSAAERKALERLGVLLETLFAWTHAEERYRYVISTIEDCLVAFSYDSEGERTFSFITRQVEDLVGRSAEELMGGGTSWIGELAYPSDRPALQAFERRIRAGEEGRLVYRVAHSEGGFRWIRESLSPRYDSAGRLVIAGILSDVTDQKKAEGALLQAKQDAEAADRMKSAFLATMSHEMRTPLGVIKGFSDLLRDELKDVEDLPAEIPEFLSAIQGSASKVLRLVGDLLDLSRLQTGRLPLENTPLAMVPLVNGVVSRFKEELVERGVTVNIELNDSDPIVLGDRGRLEQVLEIVLSNASKFTEHGSVSIGVAADPHVGIISVTDTGVGIAADSLTQVFEPFFQEDNSLNRSFEGSGLGLALARRLMEAMHGSITLDSKKGEGTTVTIELPRADS